jgi:hypothetical protein
MAIPRLGRTRRVKKASTMASAGGTMLYHGNRESVRPSQAAEPHTTARTPAAVNILM